MESDDIKHLREIMDERDCRYEQRFAAQERAIEKRDAAQDRHDAWANGLIEDARRKEMSFISKEEYNRRHDEITRRQNISDRMVWIGLGAVLLIGLVMPVVLHFAK